MLGVIKNLGVDECFLKPFTEQLKSTFPLFLPSPVLGSDFLKYMEAFKPFLVIGLKNYAEYQVMLG